MALSHEEFVDQWKQLGESQEPHAVDAAWRRYQLVSSPSHLTESEADDPSAQDLESGFDTLLSHEAVKESTAEHKFITLPANRIPWTSTGVHLIAGTSVSTFASGRVWRSRLLDLWLWPQFAVWFKVGINGTVFSSTWHSNTFDAAADGELYVANQFPGQFGEPNGGRLAGPLSIYEKTEGRFEILVIVWKDGVKVSKVFEKVQLDSTGDTLHLATQELEHIGRVALPRVPEEWKPLWFLGAASIFSLGEHESQPCMHCRPYQNVGILQKNLDPPLPLSKNTRVSWDWLVSSLPSRLREDLTISHDYLSIAFEFENGRDLTYTWSWKLSKDYGYWCPLPTWADREYHIVIRSGTEELGQWLHEERDIYADYVKYVEEGIEESMRIPQQIVRAWLIAGNRWQRFEGEMEVKQIFITQGDASVRVL